GRRRSCTRRSRRAGRRCCTSGSRGGRTWTEAGVAARPCARVARAFRGAPGAPHDPRGSPSGPGRSGSHGPARPRSALVPTRSPPPVPGGSPGRGAPGSRARRLAARPGRGPPVGPPSPFRMYSVSSDAIPQPCQSRGPSARRGGPGIGEDRLMRWTRAAVLAAALATAACRGAARPSPEAPRPGALSNAEIEALYRARLDSARMRFTEADVRFMTGMIAHHAQALVMAELAATHTTTPAIRTLAARIINAQKDEIERIQQWLRERGQPVPEVHIE